LGNSPRLKQPPQPEKKEPRQRTAKNRSSLKTPENRVNVEGWKTRE